MQAAIEEVNRAAAGPTARDALTHTRGLGYGEGYLAMPCSLAEVDDAELDARAAGLVQGDRPWWRETGTQ